MQQAYKDDLNRIYLKQIREDNGYQQAEYATKLGISLTYLKSFEGDKAISTESLIKLFIKISEISHISVYDLMLLETDYQLKKLEIEKARGESDN